MHVSGTMNIQDDDCALVTKYQPQHMLFVDGGPKTAVREQKVFVAV